MAKALYFDAFNGVSGDMILGALLNLGLPLEHLQEQLAKLDLGDYRLEAAAVDRQGLRATDFRVIREDLEPGEDAHHHHRSEPASGQPAGPGAPHRSLSAIRQLIAAGGLDTWVAETASRIFQRLGEAEAKVHETSVEAVHFHEVGAVDSIVDIVGSCIGFHYFGIRRFYSSPLALGGGTVSFSHGRWPVPTPATAELLRDFPARMGPLEAELTTPTGAAIVTALVRQHPPVLRFRESGFGAGDREFREIPNLLRLILAETEEPAAESSLEEPVVLLEAAIDNMDGELLGHILELCLNRGALDVYYLPLQMKKSRPGVLLSILTRPEDRDRMAELVFQETTTLGVRCSTTRRFVLDRDTRKLETEWGPVGVKVAKWRGRVVNRWPEYEDLRTIAENRNLPLKQVRHRVWELMGREEYE